MWTILDKILDQVLIRASSPSKCFTTTEKHNNWLCQVRYNSGCSRADVPSSNIFFCLSSRRTTLLFFLLQSVWDLTFMVTLKLLDIKMCILYFMAFYQIWKNNNPLILPYAHYLPWFSGLGIDCWYSSLSILLLLP